jgi:putative ABC transport system ATP-binding protein
VVDSETVLEVSDLTRTYRVGDRDLTVLHGVSFSVNTGESLSIIGPSGSGKSTLLGLCAGLDRPTSGSVKLAGAELAQLDEDGRAELRNQHVGFVFQAFQLLPTLTALENVMVPMELRGAPVKEVHERAMTLLDEVGLRDRATHYPTQLSGGEQQRVAIARAFMTEPRILFADEPTGNLDTETGLKVEESLFAVNRNHGTALVLVTHNRDLAKKTQRMIAMKGGRIDDDSSVKV